MEEIENEQFLNNKNNDLQLDDNNKKKKIRIIILILLLLLLIGLTIVFIIIISKKDNDNNKDNNNGDPSDKKSSHLYIEPSSGVHTHTLIFMPGLTNIPEDFAPVFTDYIPFNKKNTTKLVILRSQLQDVTVLNGTKNYSWFDIYSFPINSPDTYNFEELKKSSNLLKEIIEEEVGILGKNYEKIIIGGHSQGAMISLYTGYSFKNKLGGVISWSGALPPIKREDISNEKEDLNVFFAYGDIDTIITPEYFTQSIEEIKNFNGLNITIYQNHAHSVCHKEMEDTGIFLDNIM